MLDLKTRIASDLALQDFQVNNVIRLLFEEDCTIPFIARYRKEQTGTLDEVVIRSIRDRYTYLRELDTSRAKYLKTVEEHCKNNPKWHNRFEELKRKFEACQTKNELEDLYLPFKPKRRTRGQKAREKGLEPLLDKIITECHLIADLDAVAEAFVTTDTTLPPTEKVQSVQEALGGASDILAERISETSEYRLLVRQISRESGLIVSKKIESQAAEEKPLKGKKNIDPSKYESYFDFSEPLKSILPHRIMAVRRGESEKVLRVSVDVDTDSIIGTLQEKVRSILVNPTKEVQEWVAKASTDAYKRLIGPSIETELRLELKQQAEKEAIKVFSENLENLLLLPPIPNKIVMGVDPGLRTGSKLAVVSETGKLLTYETVYTDLGKKEGPKTNKARQSIINLIKTHKVQCIAIGNGTGSREIGRIIADAVKEAQLKNIRRLVINEAGASVYSTDDIAREEFPDIDPTIRSAISIARRLQDPLAELVKIDPRSIGVGQYQHDVNVTKLKNSLEEVVESCVNRVGVNLNTASFKLLSYVSGLSPSLSKSIVSHRDSCGGYTNRNDLNHVVGFGPKAFQQAAGFLRIPAAGHPLDNSSVHPERYGVVEQIALDCQSSLGDLIGNEELINKVPLEKYVAEDIGMPTLKDIMSELVKPGRDPRDDGSRLTFSDDLNDIEDLKVGQTLSGTVTNVTNFGAFVDIGVHQDGLVHISELSDTFINDPSKVAAVGKVLKVRVIDVDLKRRRISLSCRQPAPNEKSTQAAAGGDHKKSPFRGGERPARDKQQPRSSNRNGAPQQPSSHRRNDNHQQIRNSGPRRNKNDMKRKPPSPNYTMDDLLAKFNKRN